ncbi:GPI ethanolamine phosphate transferase 2-like isoform X2 [Antedon mediterranea]
MKLLLPTFAIILITTCITAQLQGLFIFIKGFLPIKQIPPGHASHSDAAPEPSYPTTNNDGVAPEPSYPSDNDVLRQPMFGRLVLVLIDAFRWDFLLGDKKRMIFTQQLIDSGYSLSFIAKAHSPTVTMPRVKALTSGTIPGFVDVILNVDSKALLEDNIIYQLKVAGYKMLFYGDDTWIRLFPNSFDEVDGTTSFFVSDYTEVDDNVTRHLKPTLAREDWDVLILHYLGLDHIGHIGGPASPLVQPKLQEMDSVLSMIYTSMERKDMNRELPSLLVLCGDHGMSETGSHGGASPSEILTPLVMLSSKLNSIEGSSYPYGEVQQIDMAPSLATMFGLPIPQNSLGIIIPEVLNLFPLRQQLRALQLNSNQLMTLMKQSFNQAIFDDITIDYQHIIEMHAGWLNEYANKSTSAASKEVASKIVDKYFKVLKMMQSNLSETVTRYDVHAMICGIVLCSMVLVLIGVALTYTSSNSTPMNFHISKLFYLGCCCLAILTTHVTICTSGLDTSDMLCNGSPSAIMHSTAFVITVAVAIYLQISILVSLNTFKILSFIRSLSILEKFLLLGSVTHTISLMSSSFVEEEHQTWYFLTTTLLVGLFVRSIQVQRSEDAKLIFVILIICRVLRSWNQTGMKWANLPDIGDWLVRPENAIYLSVVHVLSLAAVYVILSERLFSPSNILILLFICLYRHAVGNVVLPVLVPSSYKGIAEARITFVLLLLKIFSAIFNYLQNISKHLLKTKSQSSTNNNSGTRLLSILYESFILFVVLLLRPHNTAVVAMTLFIQRSLEDILFKLSLKAWNWSVICFWMGQTTFYHQGNSNSIATIDLSSGYVGLDSHDPAFVGTFLLVATNFGPVSWMLTLLKQSTYNSHKIDSTALPQAFLSLMLCRALPLAAYTIVVSSQRYHLFIWSVFSPKLLYEAMHTCVLVMFIIFGSTFFLVCYCTRPQGPNYLKRK